MSGTFPTIGVRSVTPKSRHNNFRSETVSGRQQVRNRGGQRWELAVVFPPMTRAAFAPVLAFLEAQDGGLDTFQFVLPVLSSTSGSVSGSALTAAAGAVGATSIAMDGITGTLKAGDFVKFGGHSKVYCLTADRAGAGTISFKPSLRAAVADNEAITYANVPFTVRLANDVQEYPASTSVHFNYEVDLLEAI